MFSISKVFGLIDEVIIARIDQKCHKNSSEMYLDFLIGYNTAKMKQNVEVFNII